MEYLHVRIEFKIRVYPIPVEDLINITETRWIRFIGVDPITQLCTCVIKIVTFKGGRLMW